MSGLLPPPCAGAFLAAPARHLRVNLVPISCPHCAHRINLKSAKPGRYRPRCPKCEQAFALVIPAEAGAAYEIRVLESDTRPNAPINPREKTSHPLGGPLRSIQTPVAAAAPAPSSQFFATANTNFDLGPAAKAPLEPEAPKPPLPHREDDFEYTPPSKLKNVKGYRIERELGRGGMGTVYLARQLSLDRAVALKVMSKRWANDPRFVARFTREAYAAAQLSHPNIVHIHDIGEVAGSRFFSMEFVPGRSLAEVVRKEGKLDAETAVGYVLQAARGLKHAHDRGMIHRDVKPDNLLLDDQGMVKVADLGLVKTRRDEPEPAFDPSSTPRPGPRADPNLTEARIALGTPAYMSPEQCRDAATVDHRADIYSLGCTLYVLVTGRPPFEGTTAVELMTKHAYEPMIPPERIVARLPAELSAVIQRMMAKGADERFQTMDEVVRTLEAWLGVRHAGTFSPREEQIGKLESYALAYNAAPMAVLRARVVQGCFSLAVLAAILLLFFGRGGWALGIVGLVVQCAAAHFVIRGLAHKGPLFVRARQLVWGLGWCDAAIAVAGIGLFALLLAMSGLFWIWCGFGVIGVGIAFGLRFGLDRPADEERRGPIEGCEKMLRRLRAQGLDEDDLRQFVAKFAGRHWEAFFEDLFGYEEKLAARAVLLRGGSAGPREKHASWREPLANLIDRIVKARKDARERKLLAAVERAQLIADGAAQDEADRKALATADAMIHHADRVRRAESERVKIGIGAPQAAYPPPAAASAIASGTANRDFAFVPPKASPFGQLLGFFVGPHIRAILAAVLLAGCGTWAHQNGLIPGSDVQKKIQAAVESQDSTGLEQAVALNPARATTPLQVDGVAAPMTAWVDSFNVGIAGLLLLGSLCFRGNAMSLLVLLGAGIAVAGHHLGIRTVEPVSDYHVALLLGIAIALVGFRTGMR